MADYEIEKDGDLLLIKKDGVYFQPVNLNTLEIKIDAVAQTMRFQNGNLVPYVDVISPASVDFEDLVRQIGEFI